MNRKTILQKGWPIVFWLLVWHLAARALGQPILLVSPVDALRRLGELLLLPSFWKSVGFSLGRILLGFLMAAVLGMTLAAAASRFRPVRELAAPLNAAVKAVPVASFAILALLWAGSRNLSVIISLLIGLPVIYANTLAGLDSLDPKLAEMARVFRLPPARRVLHVELPQMMPHLRSGLTLAAGMAFKSGVAAEVIGIPSGSVGEMLYQSKIYLETADLLAWTLVIVLLSVLCEKTIILLLRLLEGRCARCWRR